MSAPIRSSQPENVRMLPCSSHNDPPTRSPSKPIFKQVSRSGSAMPTMLFGRRGSHNGSPLQGLGAPLAGEGRRKRLQSARVAAIIAATTRRP